MTLNQGVKEIEFYHFKFSLQLMEVFVRILKKNKTIKTVKFWKAAIPDQAWARFCDGMEYYNITDIIMDAVDFDESRMQNFCNGISLNSTIRSFTIGAEQYMDGRRLEILCNMLENRTILETLKLINCLNASCDRALLKGVIKANCLKVLNIQLGLRRGNLQQISKELQENTSITDLRLKNNADLDWSEVCTILENNKTIKKLDLSFNYTLNERYLAALKLGDNKSITDLDLQNCEGISMDELFSELKRNSTIKILRIGRGQNITAEAFESYLSTTKALRELHIKPLRDTKMEDFRDLIIGGLKVSKTLRKLVVKLANFTWSDLKQILEYLKTNTTLTHLDMCPSYLRSGLVPDTPHPMTELDLYADLLKTNKTLRHIVRAEHLEGLKSNIEEQDSIISNMCILIKMILMKPNSFILPIEVWSNIFKHTSYSFVPFDFEDYISGRQAFGWR